MFELNYEDKGNVIVNFYSEGKNPGLRIDNSHVIKDKTVIWEALRYIHSTDEYKELVASGYNRTMKSEFYEWAGHNVLYRLGFMKTRTGTVDIDNNEPIWRRMVYAFLSMF